MTQLVIHELGHSVGLMHPFSYGSTQDYVPSAMSYSTHEYGFSQFDKDALARGHADQVLRTAVDAFSKMPEVSFRSGEAASIAKTARAELERGLAEYRILNYPNALESFVKIPKMVQDALKAEAEALQREFQQTRLLFLAVGIALGVAVCFVVVKITARGKKAQPVLAPSPAPRKYCVECGRELPVFAVYCGGCGAKQPTEEMK